MSKDLVKEITKQVIKTTSLFKVDEEFNDDRFCRVRIAAMHSGKNRNNSVFELDVIKKAKDTFKNIPILAEVRKLTDDEGNEYLDYGTHAMHIEEDFYDKDNLRMIYDERVVGIVPESNNFEVVHDDDTGNDYVYVDALLLRDYGNYVCDILEQRGGKTDVSMEIACDDISINAKDNSIIVNEMTACAITLLGADVQPGMAKANAQMFSLNESDRESQLIELLSELNKKLDSFNNIEFSRKEDAQMKKEFEDEVVETSEGKVEESADDTPDVKAENFEDTKKKKKAEDDDTVIVDDDDKEPDQQEEPKPEEQPKQEETPQQEEESQQEEEEPSEEEPEDVNYYSVDYAVTVNGEKKEFSVSLREKLNALTTLVNDTYGEADGAWYDVDVLEESKTVEFHDWWANKHYRQSYSVKKDVYSLKGDRIETFVSFLTADEKSALEQMKSNYSAIETELAQYKAEPEKLEVLASADYEQIKDTDAYKDLAKRDTYFSMSKDELVEKLDACLLEFAKTHKIEFSAEESEKKSVGMKLFGNPTKKATKGASRYGGIFSK